MNDIETLIGAACESCHFYQNATQYGGQCFRHPPVPTVQYCFDGNGVTQFDNLRPAVGPREWCGDYARARTEARQSGERG